MSHLGERVKECRKRFNLSQKELAAQMGFNSFETISKIEHGERAIKAIELAKFARLFKVEISDLLVSPELPQLQNAFLWRKTPRAGRELQEATFLEICRQYSLVQELSGEASLKRIPQAPVISVEALDYSRVEILAEEMRRELNLGDRPASQLENTLQNSYGVKVWYQELGEGSAACCYGEFGPAILMNRLEAPWRRNYNFAHEVFHLITWESFSPKKVLKKPNLWNKVEKLANAFASCLLLPSNVVLVEFRRREKDKKITYGDLVSLARSLDVSTEALLYRLSNLKLLSKEAVDSLLRNNLFRSIDRSTMAHSWWIPPTFPERFVRLAFLAFQKGKISKAKLAQLLNSSLFDLPSVLSEYGYDDQEGYCAEVRAS